MERIAATLRRIRFSALWLTALAATATSNAGDTLRVGPDQPYADIGGALAASHGGDLILIGPGNYTEAGLVADKAVALRGIGWPVIQARDGKTILEIRSDGVQVRGCVLRGVAVNYVRENAAIWIHQVSGVSIRDNRFESDFFCVYGTHARRVLVADNRMQGLSGKEMANGNGVHFWRSDSLTITGNTVRGQRDGIYLEFTGHSLVTGNLCEGNIRYGLHFMFSNHNAFRGNVFRHNGSGVAVMYSGDIEMRGNRFERNWGTASYGLLLKAIDDSRIVDNRFEKNTVAIYESTGDRTNFTGNVFSANGWAMKIDADCSENRYAGNRFENNTFDVAYNASPSSTNVFQGNAWDHYQGWDLDGDGVGDIPHRPVDLYSTLIQNHPQAMALLRSHFVTLLDVLERIFPTLSPPNLEDRRPLMPDRVAARRPR